MSAIGNPSPKDIRNFQENFCSGPLSDEKLKLFNPNKMDIASLKKAGISKPLNTSDLKNLRDNVRKVHDYIQKSGSPLSHQQEKTYQTNYSRLQNLISPKSYELEYYETRDKQELEWMDAGWLPQDRIDFRNYIGTMHIDLTDPSQNPFHPDHFTSVADSKYLADQIAADVNRGNSILIRQNRNQKKLERFPPNTSLQKTPDDLFKDFENRLKALGYSKENDPKAYTAISQSMSQLFHRQTWQGSRDHGLLDNLNSQFPIYCTAQGIARKGSPEEKIPNEALAIETLLLRKGDHPPVIIDLENRTSSSFLILSYQINGPDLPPKIYESNQFISMDEKTPLIYLGVKTVMEWDTGKVEVSGMEPLAIRNLHTGEMQVLKRPEVQLRSDDWAFPPQR